MCIASYMHGGHLGGDEMIKQNLIITLQTHVCVYMHGVI